MPAELADLRLGSLKKLSQSGIDAGAAGGIETLDQYFDIFVGMVTGRDLVFKDPTNQVE